MTKILAFLKSVPVVVYLVLGLVAAGAGWLALDRKHQRETGALNVLIAQAEQTNATLRHAQDSLAGIYRTDTLRLTKIKRVTDSLTVTVDRWKHDTLKVVEYVQKADSTEQACEAAKLTCEQRVKVAQDGWAGARAEIAKIKALPTPGWIPRHTAASVGLGATYGQDGRIAVGPTVSFGFRFFP